MMMEYEVVKVCALFCQSRELGRIASYSARAEVHRASAAHL